MKICKKCGATYEGEEKFCKVCGNSLDDMSGAGQRKEKKQAVSGKEKPAKPVKQVNPAKQTRPVKQAPPVQPEKRKGTSKGPKKGKAWIYVLIVVLAAALMGGSVFALKMTENKKQEEREREEEEERKEEKEKEEKEKEEKKEDKEEEKKDDEEEQEDAEKEEKEKEEAKKKEEEEQAELLKKYEEQERLEAEEKAKAEAEQKAKEEKESGTGVAVSSNVAASSSKTVYGVWQDKLANAEVQDAQLLNSMPSDGNFDGVMTVEQSRYDLWDGLLNAMWQDLKKSLSESDMDALTDEQVDWIHQKEAMIANYWSTQSGDNTSYPNAPASDATKSRVYYLLNYCPN